LLWLREVYKEEWWREDQGPLELGPLIQEGSLLPYLVTRSLLNKSLLN